MFASAQKNFRRVPFLHCVLTRPPAWSTCRYDHRNISSGPVCHCARLGRPQHEGEPFQPPRAYFPAGGQGRGRNDTQWPHRGNQGYVIYLPLLLGLYTWVVASRASKLLLLSWVDLRLHATCHLLVAPVACLVVPLFRNSPSCASLFPCRSVRAGGP